MEWSTHDWAARLHPQGLAGRRAGLLLAAVCAAVLTGLLAAEVGHDVNIGALSVFALVVAGWWLGPRVVVAVATFAVVLRMVAFGVGHGTAITTFSQVVIILVMAAAAQFASMSIVSANASAAMTRQMVQAQAVLDSGLDAVVTIDAHDLVRGWNPRAVALFGWTRDEALGRNLAELIIPEMRRAEYMVRLENYRRNSQGHMGGILTVTAMAQGGREFPIELAISPGLLGPTGTTYTAFVRDVTERLEGEEAVRRALVAAEDASTAKTEFLSRMSHELRTPLSAVLGFAELMKMEEPRPDQVASLDTIVQAGNHLLAMIDDLLDISRIESGHESMSLEPVKLREVIEECRQLISVAAAAAAISMDATAVDRALTVQADRQRLKQVVLNLLSNAVKYNRPGGRVTVGAQNGGGRVHLTVRDTGSGIPLDLLPRLFQPFERLGAERTHVPGTGLGLALCKRLVEAMGGTIVIESSPGVGLTVEVELAVATEALREIGQDEPTSPPPPPGSGDGHSDLVLYVEDNLANLELVTRVLEHRPTIEVVPAMQGGLGLELARQQRPALILLDLHLPDIDGDEVLQRLKADRLTSAIPVIMLSADATERNVQRLLDAGAQDYLTKPIRATVLLDAVDRALTHPDEPTSSASSAPGTPPPGA